jgi:hypothetical protein
LAVINDGSCQYPFTTWTPEYSVPLEDTVIETSGLIWTHGKYWTMNDDSDPAWYAIDSVNGNVMESYQWVGLQNIDWEEIQQNDEYYFIGDIGNNSGNRTDLKFFRIPKMAMGNFTMDDVDTISFHYQDQFDFNNATNDHDFDCEAFLVDNDSIYLFTKCWASHTVGLYAMSNSPGDHAAVKRTEWNVQGMITGAHWSMEQNHVVLVGYNELVQPFAVLLYDFPSTQFLSGNKRKISLGLPFHQIEAVASADGLHYFFTNEKLVQGFTVPAQLHAWNATSFLMDSLVNVALIRNQEDALVFFPNPSNGSVMITGMDDKVNGIWRIENEMGQVMDKGILKSQVWEFDISHFAPGNYFLVLGNHQPKVIHFIKSAP